MKIYEYSPVYFVRLQITQQKQDAEYLTLCDTTIDEVKEFLTNLLNEQKISPFETTKTSINIREALGGKNGKSTSISFRGLNPKKTLDLITNNLKNKQDANI